MIPWYVSIVPIIVSLTGSYYVGNKKWYGFAISLSVQLVWLGYGIVSHQWPFILAPFVYVAMHYRNMQKWRREDKHARNRAYAHKHRHTYVQQPTTFTMNADTIAYPTVSVINDSDVVPSGNVTSSSDDDIVRCGDRVIAHITGVVDVVYDNTIVLNVIDAHGDTYHVTFDTGAAGVSLSGPYNDNDNLFKTNDQSPIHPGIQVRYILRDLIE